MSRWSEVWRVQRQMRIYLDALPDVRRVKAAAVEQNDRLIELLEDLEFDCQECDRDRDFLRGELFTARRRNKELERAEGYAK